MQNTNFTPSKPSTKEKVMSYEEKSVGTTPFFKCEACPYMALAEDDIKFHLFTVHPDLAKKNGLADNIQIACPGCTCYFDAEETLRNHLRNHHKMGIKDIKKMVKSLVQIALKDATLKRENPVADTPPPNNQELDLKIPEVIELAPNITGIDETTGKTITFITVGDLQNMNTNNIEKVNPNHMIHEASIDIVYSDELAPIPAQYMNVTEANASPTACPLIQLPSAPPDLISCIQPNNNNLAPKPIETHNRAGRPIGSRSKDDNSDENITEVCTKGSCHLRMKSIEKLAYHRQCHRDGKLLCKECNEIFITIEALHTHLWKSHRIDMELPTCEICGYKTYKKHVLFGRHMKCHSDKKDYTCKNCGKKFKNCNQLSKHRLTHKEDKDPITCTICQIDFPSKRRWKMHVSSVHEKLKPFQCPYCDYAATRKEALKLHMRSHTGDKPYSCDQCTYKSADHNSLRRHKKLHTKENLYKCKYCPYTTIQSTVFASHMISTHPNISEEIHRCPYCKFKSISKEKYVNHLTTHPDKEGIKLLIEMNQDSTNKSKPSWTIPSQSEKDLTKEKTPEEKINSPKTTDEMPIEVYDCDSQTEPQAYPKNYSTHTNKESDNSNFSEQSAVTDLSKDDTNSDCLITETTNDSMLERHQYNSPHLQNIVYDNNPSNLHYLNPTVTLEQSMLQNNIIDSLPTSHVTLENRISNIMSNFPIRLPLAPPLPQGNNFTLKAINKIPLQMSKVMGPIIKPTQILPVPLSSNSPVSSTTDPEGVPRKKPKISVKSNLILKGPDQDNMFHSQQKLAFRRLEDNERFGMGPVTFNNLITNQYMHQPLEPLLSESPSNIIPYPQETMLRDTPTTPEDRQIKPTNQIFSFNQQMNVNPIPLLPPQQKIQTSSYIKMETTIKQNTQSPSLERMCSANAISQVLTEYKASPPLEDIHKNMNEIKNEVKSDFYSIPLNNSGGNSIMDQYLMDNLIGEQYVHIDLPSLQDMDDQQADVIEIDDNSDDTKILPRLEMNFPLDSYYLMHNDFHFLENDIPSGGGDDVRMNGDNLSVQSENVVEANDYSNILEGRKDPMMNVSVRPCTNKINVKNIELMKN